MNKAALTRAFAIILTAFLFIVSGISAYADELDGAGTDMEQEYYYTEPQETTGLADYTDPTVPTTEPIIPAKFPALTVNAISNFFPKSGAEYNVKTKEITVTYWLKSTKDVLTTQWFLEYDPEALSFSLEKNPSTNICPSIGYNSILSFPNKGKIGYCATNISLFDFSSQDMPFVQIVFDVININPDEPILTKIDLTVENLTVADIDNTTGRADPESELALVDSSIENPELDPLFERVTKMTTLTPSNFVQATDPPSQPLTVPVTDQSGSIVAYQTVVPTTAAASTAPTQATSLSETVPPTTEPATEPPDMGSVPTGGTGYAFICLGVIVVSASILFVMRKKEIMY